MLKPMLARGELHTIGATTLDEYRKYIEKDAALERRFQPVFVGEPTVEDTISILRGLRERYEAHHKVRILDSALVAAAVLSNRYIADRFLPDKAIDLVDEAASKLRMEMTSMPVELDEAERRDHAARDRARGAAQGEGRRVARATREAREGAGRSQGAARCAALAVGRRAPGDPERSPSCASRSTRPKVEIEQAQRAYDFNRAAELQYGKLGQLEQQMREAEQQEAAAQDGRLAQGRGRRRGHRRGRQPLDRHSGQPADRRRDREAAQDGGSAPRARRRPGRGDHGRRQRDPALPGRALRSEPAAGQLHLPRPDRRRQDRAGAGAGGVPVRRRSGDGPDRHVGVHGAALRQPADRRASGLRRLRRGRAADRGGAPPALQRGPLRRDREGAPGCLQRAAADPGRRSADRWPGPHGRLQEHRHHHDQQPRLDLHHVARSSDEEEMRDAGDGGACAATSGPSS